MDFETEYKRLSESFAKYLSSVGGGPYIAPGDSVRYLVERMKSYARKASLALPTIHVLTHDESWLLYGEKPVLDILERYIPARQPRRIHFLEDHFWEGDKIHFIQTDLLVRKATIADFTVMVGSKKRIIPLYHTDVFETNHEMAYALFERFDRHKRGDGSL